MYLTDVIHILSGIASKKIANTLTIRIVLILMSFLTESHFSLKQQPSPFLLHDTLFTTVKVPKFDQFKFLLTLFISINKSCRHNTIRENCHNTLSDNFEEYFRFTKD